MHQPEIGDPRPATDVPCRYRYNGDQIQVVKGDARRVRSMRHVFYEMGIARLSHDVIMLAESSDDLPFEVAHFRSHIYGNNPLGVRKAVAAALEIIAQKSERPVLRHLAVEVVSEQVVAPLDGDEFCWLGQNQELRPLPDRETSAIFAAGRAVVRMPRTQLRRLKLGPPIPALTKNNFRRINVDFFVLAEGLWFYLNTLAPIYEYGWAVATDVPEMTEEERRTHRPFH